jgi:hypothetical protein
VGPEPVVQPEPLGSPSRKERQRSDRLAGPLEAEVDAYDEAFAGVRARFRSAIVPPNRLGCFNEPVEGHPGPIGARSPGRE